MAFESKRLRVQLPCKKAGTLVEKEPAPDLGPGACGFPTQACQGLQSPACEGANSPIMCRFPTDCRYPTLGCPGIASPTTCVYSTRVCREFATRNCGFPTPVCNDFGTDVCNRFVSFEVGCERFGTDCPQGSVVCRGGGTDPWETINCTPSELEPIERIPFEPFAEDPETVLVHPDHLPQLRRHLETELERISALEARKAEVEGQLKDLDVAEKELKKQAKRK